MARSAVLLLAALGLAAPAAAQDLPPAAPAPAPAEALPVETTTGDRIMAVVGEKLLLASEWREQTALLAAQFGVERGTDAWGSLARETFDQMVRDLMIVSAAERDTSIQVPLETLQEETENEIAAIRQRFPSEEEFQRQIRQSQWGSLAAYRADVQERKRNEILGQLYLEKHRGEIRPAAVTDADVRAYWEESREGFGTRPEAFRFEEIPVPPTPSEAERERARAEAEATLAEIRGGRAFDAAAREHNPDETADRGGDLGWFGRGQMVPPFEAAAFETSVGEIAGPIETRYGFHLVQPIDKRADEVRARHVLVPFGYDEADIERAREEAERVAELVRQGADVDSLQAARMDGDSAAAAVLEFSVRQLPEVYARPLAGMEAGDVRVVEVPTTSGLPSFNVLVSRGRTGGEPVTFEEMRERIRSQLAQQRAEEAFVERLEEDVYVDVRVPPEELLPG